MNLDFETAAAIELRKVGSYNYTRHSSFRITTLLYLLDGETQLKKWTGLYDPTYNPGGTKSAPDDLVHAIHVLGEDIIGWNVSFERYCLAWMARTDPRLANIPGKQFVCTMQQAAIVGLPLGLGNCGEAMRCRVTKDTDGKLVMLQTAKPRNAAAQPSDQTVYTPKKGHPALSWYLRHTDPAKFEILDNYCGIDVRSEVDLGRAIPDMPAGERRLATADREINSRGLPIDLSAVERALELTDFIKEDGDRRLSELTSGEVPTATQLPKLKAWLAEHGCEMESVTKSTIPEQLAREDLPEDVRKVLELRLEGGAASLKKLVKMKMLCTDDGTIKDQFQYSGSHTGRWAGRGVQPQNIFKGWDCPDKQDTFFRLLMQDKPIEEVADELREEFGDLVTACKGALRGFIKAPPGYKLYVCDFAGIENRVLAWLAGEQPLLEAFRKNEDPYVLTASRIYGVEKEDVTGEQRSLGKVAVLAAQFGQGPRGFKNTCQTPWGITITMKEARETIKAYRDSNPAIKDFWYDLYRACMSSVMTGDDHIVGHLVTQYDGKSLQIKLPTGRKLHYWNPVVKEERAVWSWTEVKLHFKSTEEEIVEWGLRPLDEEENTWKARDCDKAFFEEVSADRYTKGDYHPKYCYQLYHEQTSKSGSKKWCQIVNGKTDSRHGTWPGTLSENCWAADTVVVTDHGNKKIVDVQLDDFLWDGLQWVSHKGLVDQGRQGTITFGGCKVTPDHQIMTSEGWTRAEETNASEAETWFASNYRSPQGQAGSSEVCEVTPNAEREPLVVPVRLREHEGNDGLGVHEGERVEGPCLRMYEGQEPHARHVKSSRLRGLEFHESQVQPTEPRSLAQLRRQGNQSLRSVEHVPGFLVGHGSDIRHGSGAGQERQRRGLHSGELSLGDSTGERQQPQGEHAGGYSLGPHDRGPSVSGVRDKHHDDSLSDQSRSNGRGSVPEAELPQQVYDIRDAGPNHRFTIVNPDGGLFLAHNCTQAVAREVLAEAVLRVEKNFFQDGVDYPKAGLIGYVHDELVGLVPDSIGDHEAGYKEFERIMLQVPAWASGLPISGEGYVATRYRK